MSETEIAWCAGLFDGEGCIFIARQRRKAKSDGYSLRIAIAMVHRDTLEMFVARVGAATRICEHRSRARNTRTSRDSWQWMIQGRGAAEILVKLLPYLVTKRAEAEIALRFRDIPRERESHVRATRTTVALEGIRQQLKAAKQYEWKHDRVPPLSRG